MADQERAASERKKNKMEQLKASRQYIEARQLGPPFKFPFDRRHAYLGAPRVRETVPEQAASSLDLILAENNCQQLYDPTR